MKVIKNKYAFNFPFDVYPDQKEVQEDVLFEDKRGQRYSQFFKGQMIPEGIWDEVFSSNKTEEKVELDSKQLSNLESDESEVVEKKPRKTRRKSIIKK